MSIHEETVSRVKQEIALLASFEAKALSKGFFAAFGAYRRQRNEREATLTMLVTEGV